MTKGSNEATFLEFGKRLAQPLGVGQIAALIFTLAGVVLATRS